MKYVAARIAAGAVLTTTASLLLTVVNVYAADKPGNPGNHFGEISNPGHHYGQLKHQPTPSPSAAPTSTPPTSTGQPPASAPSGTTSGGGSTDPAGAVSIGVAALPATLPVSNPQSTTAGINAPARLPDGLSWLILVILPALIAVWLMVFARAALTAVRLSRKPA